jgi:hypothetical protein
MNGAAARRRLGPLALAALLLLMLTTRTACADVAECVQAHSKGQLERDASHLIDARELFTSCADAECPAPVRNECRAFLGSIKQRVPSLLLAARDQAGKDLTDVKVFLDDEQLPRSLYGAPIDVDPGPHRVAIMHADGRVVRLRVIALEGERDRRITAKFHTREPGSLAAQPDPEAQPEVQEAQGSRTLAYVLGGVAVAALASFGILASSGKAEENTLRSTCAPNCTEAQRDGVHRKYLWADVSLAAGVASLAGGTYFYFAGAPTPGDQAPRTQDDQRGVILGWRGVF